MVIKAKKSTLDFDMVWKDQAMPPPLARSLIDIAAAIRSAVTQPDSSVANVTEWAKKQACWNRVQEVDFELSEAMDACLLGADEIKAVTKDAKKVQKVDNGIEAQARVLELGTAFWASAAAFAASNRLLGPTDHALLNIATRRGAIPTEKQSLRLLEALSELETGGLKVEQSAK